MSHSSPSRVYDHSQLNLDENDSFRRSLNRTRSRNERPSHNRSSRHGTTTMGIPMPAYHIKRTESEAQLHEDMAMAEYRDRCMFNRLVTGIQRQQQEHMLYDSQKHQFYQTQPQPLTSAALEQENNLGSSTTEPCQTSSMITPIASDGEDTGRPGTRTRTRRQPCIISSKATTNAGASTEFQQSSDADDWAIGGFEADDDHVRSQTSPTVIPTNGLVIGSSSNFSSRMDFGSSNDQLFDMDL